MEDLNSLPKYTLIYFMDVSNAVLFAFMSAV